MRTMTVKELRTLLETYPDETPVLATWEGVNAAILAENFELSVYMDVITLMFDVTEYGDWMYGD